MHPFVLNARKRKTKKAIKLLSQSMAFYIASILIIVLDRVSKYLAFSNIPLGDSRNLIGNILYITPTFNTGVAFGLFKGVHSYIFITISIIAIAFIIYMLISGKLKDLLLRSAAFLILSGAIGNIIDRFMYGYVLDFIDLRVWPVFNIADSAVTIGAAMIVLYLFKKRQITY
jgi:signal peptidase II